MSDYDLPPVLNDFGDDGFCSRVRRDIENFTGKKSFLPVPFLIFDCLIQNFILYLIWFAFIPEEEIEDERPLFATKSQRIVFNTYMFLYTMITILPQVLVAGYYFKTKSYSCFSEVFAKMLLICFSLFGLHQIILIFTPFGRMF